MTSREGLIAAALTLAQLALLCSFPLLAAENTCRPDFDFGFQDIPSSWNGCLTCHAEFSGLGATDVLAGVLVVYVGMPLAAHTALALLLVKGTRSPEVSWWTLRYAALPSPLKDRVGEPFISD